MGRIHSASLTGLRLFADLPVPRPLSPTQKKKLNPIEQAHEYKEPKVDIPRDVQLLNPYSLSGLLYSERGRFFTNNPGGKTMVADSRRGIRTSPAQRQSQTTYWQK